MELDGHDRIRKAICYLKRKYCEYPSLAQVAGYVGLSPFHFQRLFKQWVGITPKRFIEFLTLNNAKKLLEESRPVLDVAYEIGLSSSSRLYDLFVTIDAVTPGEFKNKGVGVKISYGIHPTPFGQCLLATTLRGICFLAFASGPYMKRALDDLKMKWPEAEISSEIKTTRSFVDRIFSSGPKANLEPVALFVQGTNFQIKVWEALLRIPTGSVATYEDIARAIGRPTAARTTANAIAHNPISYLIPCHRVICKSGMLGGYRWGMARKQAILSWELTHLSAEKEKDNVQKELQNYGC